MIPFFNADLGGPIFFELGGESAINSEYVIEFQELVYAQQEGALMVALEHRFYGESQPFTDLSLASLAYLSSDQALADAANFLEHFKQMYPSANDVIVFGGSYPGSNRKFSTCFSCIGYDIISGCCGRVSHQTHRNLL